MALPNEAVKISQIFHSIDRTNLSDEQSELVQVSQPLRRETELSDLAIESLGPLEWPLLLQLVLILLEVLRVLVQASLNVCITLSDEKELDRTVVKEELREDEELLPEELEGKVHLSVTHVREQERRV